MSRAPTSTAVQSGDAIEKASTAEDNLLPPNWRLVYSDMSFRVKCLDFHPTKPWIAAGRHSGSCVIKEYTINGAAETVVAHWDAHQGACRSVAFHPSIPLLVASAGDDMKVKLWKANERESCGTLTGHLDYLRSVRFHPVHVALLLTASDDQTLRLWDWQRQTSLCVVTGHCHYVMSAVFHPTQDLLLSASLDQTARLWSFTITTTTTAAASEAEEGMCNGTQTIASISVEPIATIEGHERGINFADFHPTQPCVVTASDDKTVRIWEQSPVEGKMVAVQTIQGHTGNVSGAIFVGPSGTEVLSVSEDESLRLHSVPKLALLGTVRLPRRRMWTCVAHEVSQEKMLVAVGHDAGFHIYDVTRNAAAAHVNVPENDTDTPRHNNIGGEEKVALLGRVTSPSEARGVVVVPAVGADHDTGTRAKSAFNSTRLAQFDVALLRRTHRTTRSTRGLFATAVIVASLGAFAAVVWLLGEIALISLVCNGALCISAVADFALGAAAASLVRGASFWEAKWLFLAAVIMDCLRFTFHHFASADQSNVGRAVVATDSVGALLVASAVLTLWTRVAVETLLQRCGTLQKSASTLQEGPHRVLVIWGVYALSCGLHWYVLNFSDLPAVATALIAFSSCAATYRWGYPRFQKLMSSPWHTPSSCGCDVHNPTTHPDVDCPPWESLEWENEIKIKHHGMPLADFVEKLKRSCGLVPADTDPSQSDALRLYWTTQPPKCLVSLGMLRSEEDPRVLCRATMMNAALDVGDRCSAIPNQWLAARAMPPNAR